MGAGRSSQLIGSIGPRRGPTMRKFLLCVLCLPLFAYAGDPEKILEYGVAYVLTNVLICTERDAAIEIAEAISKGGDAEMQKVYDRYAATKVCSREDTKAAMQAIAHRTDRNNFGVVLVYRGKKNPNGWKKEFMDCRETKDCIYLPISWILPPPSLPECISQQGGICT